MDLLDTILRSANAEAYIHIFSKNKIEASTLPLLSNQDLQILGIEDPVIRKNLIEKAAHLQIPHEKSTQINLTHEDVELILSQIAYQLHIHKASLACALNRKDVLVCDIKLNKATLCLKKCISSFEKQVDKFESHLGERVRKGKCTGKKALIIISTSTLFFVIGKLLYKYYH